MMATIHEDPRMSDRLQTEKYSAKECTAAINGECVPDALGLALSRICVIRGISYHAGFATELRGVTPEFTRALNAREIMSDHIPDISSESDTPYCIWHPNVASEETYRQLVLKYPAMTYQVGRACAVGGYTALYLSLDILPEIHIAEEARESGSLSIYEDIMSKPTEYSIMNDYDRSIDPKRLAAAHLNGDTAVWSTLDRMQAFSEATVQGNPDEFDLFSGMPGYHDNVFNITEDMNIAISPSDNTTHNVIHSDLLIQLLTNPLPLELPTVDKDLLICMAAYYGETDRYARLRRPSMVDGELQSCVRGIYHNTMFAIWWSHQQNPHHMIETAISARYIMNNSLAKVPSTTTDRTPYLIWYPTFAFPSTYAKLAELAPHMLPQILRACVVANYDFLFEKLIIHSEIKPDAALLLEANESHNFRFKSLLATHMAVSNQIEPIGSKEWMLDTQHSLQSSDPDLFKTAGMSLPNTWDSLYNGYGCNAGSLELLACLPEEWRIPAGGETLVTVDYVKWPTKPLRRAGGGDTGVVQSSEPSS